jgi:hypothetical protein
MVQSTRDPVAENTIMVGVGADGATAFLPNVKYEPPLHTQELMDVAPIPDVLLFAVQVSHDPCVPSRE